MPRVAYLYLPDFMTDRIRRLERRTAMPSPPEPCPPAPATADDGAAVRDLGWRPGARWARSDPAETGSDAWLSRRLARKRAQRAAIQAEIETLPPHQRPPMRELGRRSEPAPHPFRALPPDDGGPTGFPRPRDHGFPPRHDLDAALGPADGPPVPFRPMPADEGPALAAAEPSDFGGHVRRPERPPYDLEGAFWQQGRTLGQVVARATAEPIPPRRHPRKGSHAWAASATAPDRTPPAPDTGGVPLVVTAREGQKIVLAAACPAARALGLAAGMPLTKARAMVPGLAIRAADPAGDAADLARLAGHAARHWTPLVAMAVEAGGGAGLTLDIGAAAHLFGGEAALARRMLGLCRRLGLAARAAVADTAGAARVLAMAGGARLTLCPSGEHDRLTAPLPVAGLALAPGLADALARLGVATLGQLAALPRAPLARRFGRATLDALDRLTGARADPIDPLVPAEAPVAERRFTAPVLTVAGIGHALGTVVDALVVTLAARGLGARALALTLRRIDNADQSIALGFARPTRDAGHIGRLLAMRIGEFEPGFGIEAMRLVAVRADPLAAEPVAGPLAGRPPVPDLAELVDRLATRLGGASVFRQGAVESDVPERSVVPADPLAGPLPGWRPDWPRPARLIHPPERVHDIMALLPDGAPRRFTWRGRSHRVARGDGPERIYGEWWRRPGERDAVRDYFQVEDEAGARFWLYRRGDGVDGRTGDLTWHLHGVFG